MDATISVAVVTSIGTIIVALITFSQNISLKKQNKTLTNTKQKLETKIEEIKLVSTGMVVAYFFSFIRPLFDKIAESQLRIVDGDKEYQINRDSTSLELIVPKQLNNNSFDEANNFFKSVSGIGTIVNIDNEVLYKHINYRIAKENNEAVILIDVPAILKSALKYYKIGFYDSEDNLKSILEKEMNNFNSEIRSMITRDELNKHITIREY